MLAAAFAATPGAITAWSTRGLRGKVDNVHAEVVTLNGSTIGELASRAEDRRVADQPAED